MFDRRAALVLLALSASGCTTLDRAVGLVPLFTTMRNQVNIKPFEGPLDSTGRIRFLPPAGSVPTTGREDSLDLYTSDLRNLRNPVPATAASVGRGAKIFDTYCIVCHGPQGAGDGTVSGRFMGLVPALTTDQAKGRSDGYLYAIIRHGRGAMPAYGDRIRDQADRWNVVNYVRTVQGQGAAQ
jgi:mono/diheme cytochrome c family protein